MKEKVGMALNKDVPVQLYYQLTNELRKYIQSGNLSIGDMFPTDREIMERYKVSATTVRRAIKQLVNEGWIERTPGKGTFIRKEPIKEQLGRLTGFFDEMRAKGYQPSAALLFAGEVQIEDALKKQYALLREWPETDAILFRKVQQLNDKPIVFVNSYWKKEYGLELMKHDLKRVGLYESAEKHLGIRLTHAEQNIFAGTAAKEALECLGLKKHEPVLIMERLAYAGDELVEFSYNIYRADCYSYHVTLRNDLPTSWMVFKE